jgi:ADP-dependent NAD(P)H-hydrate dehydratase
MRPSPPDDGTLTAGSLRAWPLPSAPDDDKHDRGTVVVVAGSAHTPGAALLAGIAALRAGAGRLQIATVESSAAALAVALPEALVDGIPPTSQGDPDPTAAIPILAGRIARADAVLLGPGLEDLDGTRALLAGLLPLAGPETVVVLDALALPAWASSDRGSIAPSSGRLALTPNGSEGRSLVPQELAELGDGEIAAAAARAHGAAVTLAGHVAAPDGRRWRAEVAVPGLGTSGSGDVLAGLVAGAAARCRDPVQAACWGTHLHVCAGARLGKRVGRVGYLARELLEEIPGLLDEAT